MLLVVVETQTDFGFDVELASSDPVLDACARDTASSGVFVKSGNATVVDCSGT